VGLERGPFSLVRTTEELLDRPRGTLYPQKLAITSPTSGGRSVGIVRSRTQTMEFSLVLVSDIRITLQFGHNCFFPDHFQFTYQILFDTLFLATDSWRAPQKRFHCITFFFRTNNT
jgi:hypothetical protein